MTDRYDEGNDFDALGDLFNQPRTQEPVKKISIFSAVLGFLLIPVIAGGLIGAAVAPIFYPVGNVSNAVVAYWDSLPTELPDIPPPQRSVILDANDEVMAEIYSQNRITIPLDEVSQYAIDALVATEDRSFYEHSGYSARGIIRALRNNATGEDVQGASTITQQLVKNTLVVNADTDEARADATENSVFRKVEELKYARALEEKFTKEEILERYFNLVLYSNGVYGIGTASEYYFSIPASELNLQQSAMLIGLLKSPTAYDPIDHPEAVKNRRNTVLQNMYVAGYITVDERDAAQDSKLELNVQPPMNGCVTATDPFYCQAVLDRLNYSTILGDTEADRQAALYRGGLEIHTYFNEDDYNRIVSALDADLGRNNRVAAGVAVVEPGTGIVPAIGQNRTWGNEQDGTFEYTQVIYPDRVSFQPGSSFKPFTLAAALESGVPLDTVINAPAVYNPSYMNVPSGGITNVASYGTGTMDITNATAVSSNTFYTVLQERIGVLTVADMAENLGLSVPRSGDYAVGARDSSFTLGTMSVSPLQMAAAYAAFAADGVYCDPRFVEEVYDVYGDPIGQDLENCYQAMSPQTANNVTKVLREVVDGDNPNRSGEEASQGSRPVAGKTGTTNNQAATWFVGYTPSYAVSVWVGDPRGGQRYPLSQGFWLKGQYLTSNAYSGMVSAPIWGDVMSSLMSGKPVEQFTLNDAVSSAGNMVPDVSGMIADDAINLLEDRGYIVEVSKTNAEPNEFYEPNQVVAQSPEGGTTTLIRKTTVVLTLSADSSGFEYYQPEGD